MRSVAIVVFLATLTGALAQDGSSSGWKSVELGHIGDLAMRVCVLEVASLLDEDWIGFEIENTGPAPLRIRSAGYSIDRRTIDAETRREVSSGGLASGNLYDLFPAAWDTTPAAPILVNPGTHRILRQPSTYAAALLGLPPSGGWIIEARVRFSIELGDQQRFAPPSEGLPIRFEWRPVAPDGYEVLQARVRGYLDQREWRPCGVYLVGALLKIPEVGETFSARELLDSLGQRDGAFDGRYLLVGEIARRFSRDPATLTFYGEQLRAGDRIAISDLARAHDIWDPVFIEPLIAHYEHARWEDARTSLSVLSAHRTGWPAAMHIPSRLSARVFKECPSLADLSSTVADQGLIDSRRWTVENLALTCDVEVLPLLRPLLDRRERVQDLKSWAPMLTYPGPPLRLCDVVLEAILKIQGKDLAAAYKQADPRGHPRIAGSWRELIEFECMMDDVRDSMIDGLKRTLDEHG